MAQLRDKIKGIVNAIRARAASASINIGGLVAVTLSQSPNRDNFTDM